GFRSAPHSVGLGFRVGAVVPFVRACLASTGGATMARGTVKAAQARSDRSRLVRVRSESAAVVLTRAKDELRRLRERDTGPMYRSLGAHPTEIDGAPGTRFAVWAPNAVEVSVICDGNGWTPGRDLLWGSDSGVWSGFIRGFSHGDRYKYAIKTRTGE